MHSEYRTWVTVKAPAARSFDQWEDLLTQLETSPTSRGPVMSCAAPSVEAEFTVSYPAADVEAAAKDSIEFLTSALNILGWPACAVTVDEVQEIDLEKELLEDRRL